jgi:dihydroorotate dehydrogenase (fumarate)
MFMAGAHAVQMVSALLKNGPNHLLTVRKELQTWMAENEWAPVAEMRGNMSTDRIPNPHAYMRANYVQLVQG